MQKPNFNKADRIAEIIRVDHAGEYGAKMIYTGQLRYINRGKDYELISHMYDQELLHLEFFEKELLKRRQKPTLLMPIWHVGGYLLGMLTAKLSVKHAMICTDAVEDVIEKHYEEQIIFLNKNNEEKNLLNSIKKFQIEEKEHQNIAKNNIENFAVQDRLLYKIISTICKSAIFLSKKI